MTGLSNGHVDMDAGLAGHAGERGASGGDRVAAVSVPDAGHVSAGVVDSRVTPIPASIVRAICAIKSTVEAVKKTQKNPHGGYMFSSTDDVYAAISRKMGDVGLLCLAMEEESKLERIERDGKVSQWLRVVYSFVWATETDTWTDPRARRTLCVQVTGPQTFQAAQSFAEKSYYRSTFKIPSGDMDLDSMPQADNEDEQVALNTPGRVKRKSSAEGKRDGSVAVFNEVRGAIAAVANAQDLHALYVEHCDSNGPWSGMPPKWAEMLQDDYEVKREAFTAIQAAE